MDAGEVLAKINAIEKIQGGWTKLRPIAALYQRELEEYAETVKVHEEQAGRPLYGDPVKIIRKPEDPIDENEGQEDDTTGVELTPEEIAAAEAAEAARAKKASAATQPVTRKV